MSNSPLLEAIPHAELRIIPDVGHLSPIEAPSLSPSLHRYADAIEGMSVHRARVCSKARRARY